MPASDVTKEVASRLRDGKLEEAVEESRREGFSLSDLPELLKDWTPAEAGKVLVEAQFDKKLTVEGAKLLVEGAKADLEAIGGWVESTALYYAACNANTPVMKYLVDKGANINVRACNGGGLAIATCSTGDLEAVKYVHSLGLDFNVQNKEGWTPLHTAVYYAKHEVIKFLRFEVNVKVDIQDMSGTVAGELIKDMETMSAFTGLSIKELEGN